MSDQAVKIFEALSDVDEELLERCNQKENRKNAVVYKLFWRYGRTMAACVCMIVVGAAAWGGYHLAMSGKNSGSSGAGGSQNMAPAMPADCAQTMDAADGGMAGGSGAMGSDAEAPESGRSSTTGGMSPEAAFETPSTERASSEAESTLHTEQQKQQDQTAADQTGQAVSVGNNSGASIGGSSGTGNGGSTGSFSAEKAAELWEKENALTDSRQIVPWAEACETEPFGSYLPTALPAGYGSFSARQSANPELWNNMIFKWSDGQQILHLNMTLEGVKTKEDLERYDGVNQYIAEDFQREMIPEPGPDGQILFTLYYGDGMKIDFGGYVTADEMWEVVESVSK